MRKYELMTIFPIEEDLSKAAQESVRKILADFGAEIENETPYGDRELCYEVKKRNKGRFVLLNIKANPSKIIDIDRQFKLEQYLLKFMFVRIDD